MNGNAKGFMTMRVGLAIIPALATAAIVGGSMAGVAYWPLRSSSLQVDAVVSPTASTPVSHEPSGNVALSEVETKGPDRVTIVEHSVAPAPSQQTATDAVAHDPSTRAGHSAPPDPAFLTAPLASRLVPLPMRRPPEFRSSRTTSAGARPAARPAPRVAAAPSEDNRTFVEKLFGIERSDPPRVAYAALETKPVDNVFRRTLNAVPSGSIGGVATYDIRAKVVTLPNGEKLEAHSGLGESMDDPAHMHIRMKGPTPVGTYDISEREQPFHGVRALRLNPVGGPEAVHGRVGLLTHTYLLGANGASNGCVSFKDYDKFLQAYLRGEVQRLVVVAGG